MAIEVTNVTRNIKVIQDRRDINLKKVLREVKVTSVGRRGATGATGATGPQGEQGDPGTTDYNELDNLPTLGTAAATDAVEYATAAQGATADSAVQPDDLATVATTGDYDDLVDKPTIPDVSQFETTTQLNARDTANRSRANHTGTQAISTVVDLQTSLDAKANDASVVHLTGAETIAGPKTFTDDTTKVGKLFQINAPTGNPEFNLQESGTTRSKFYYDIANNRFVIQNNESNAADAVYITEHITTTGDIHPGGNVDGRDVAADGTKLDGIASGAEVNTVDSVNGATGAVVLGADDIDDTLTTHKYVTSDDLTNLSNLSGVNTGDQDLSGYALLVGRSGGQTLIGGTASGERLVLKANDQAWNPSEVLADRSVIEVQNSTVAFTGQTTVQSSGGPIGLLYFGETVTTANTNSALPMVVGEPQVIYTVSQNVALFPTFYANPTYRPAASGIADSANNLFSAFLGRAAMSIDHNGTSTHQIHTNYHSQPWFRREDGRTGTATLVRFASYRANGSIIFNQNVMAGWTVTNFIGFLVDNPTTGGGGVITNNIGLDIASLTAGSTTNIGVRIAPSTSTGAAAISITGTPTTAAGGILFGGDVNLFRSAANVLQTNDTMRVGALRIDVTPTAETPSATHTAAVNLNGTNYKFLCLAA